MQSSQKKSIFGVLKIHQNEQRVKIYYIFQVRFQICFLKLLLLMGITELMNFFEPKYVSLVYTVHSRHQLNNNEELTKILSTTKGNFSCQWH